jgi:hypothetical protein
LNHEQRQRYFGTLGSVTVAETTASQGSFSKSIRGFKSAQRFFAAISMGYASGAAN